MRLTATFLVLALLIAPAFGRQAAATKSTEAGEDKASARALPADAPSKEQLMRLFNVMEVQKQLSGMMNAMGSQMEKMMPSNMGSLTEQQKSDMAKLQGDMLSKMMSPEFVDRYLLEIIPIYQQHFTKAEVKELTSFFSSPIGRKLLHEQPQLTKESLSKIIPLMQQRLQDVSDEIDFDGRMKQILAESEGDGAAKKQ